MKLFKLINKLVSGASAAGLVWCIMSHHIGAASAFAYSLTVGIINALEKD